MRRLIRLSGARSCGLSAVLAIVLSMLACSDSSTTDDSAGGAAGSNASGTGAMAGNSGGRAGNGGSSGAPEGGIDDASGGAGGADRDASTRDASGGSDPRDVRGETGGAGGVADAGDGTGGPRDGAGGTSGAGGAMDGGDTGSRDAAFDADADTTSLDARTDADAPIVDGSTDDSGDASPGSDSTSIVAAGVRWRGRVDATDANAPRFSWSGTGFAARFSGTSVGVDLQNDDAYFFQTVIDGQKGERFQAAKGRATRTVATGLAAGSHTLELYREIETYYGTSQFFGITQATLQAPPPSRARLLEFVGDSISAGYGNLGNEPHIDSREPSACTFSFDTESAYMSYGAVAARALGADVSIIAESGWGVYRDRTGGTDEVLPKVYDRTLGNSATPVWDFRTQPQAVIINLGTNDFAPGDPGTGYATALGAFVDSVRGHYPAAWIFCAVGTMFTNAEHAQALTYTQSVINARGGDSGKFGLVDLGSQDETQGTGCDWHPSIAEHQRMANVLVPVLKQKLGW